MTMKDNVIAIVMEKQTSLSLLQATEYVSRAEEHFLELTKRTTVPPRATWLWVDLSLAFYNESLGGSSGKVASIKRGDTTVSYADGSAELSSIDALNDKVMKYRVVLSR